MSDPGTNHSGKRATSEVGGDEVLGVVLAGHAGDVAAARRALEHRDGRARAAALGALARAGALGPDICAERLGCDPSAAVRRRAAELSATFGRDTALGGAGGTRADDVASAPPGPDGGALVAALRKALADPDPLVAETAAWALGEREQLTATEELATAARTHPDQRVREAAIAALGAIGPAGGPAGLAAVLAALEDRASVRRRAVVALAAFEGDEVSAALRHSAADRDWQVREVAEILLES